VVRDGQSVAAEAGLFIAENQDRKPDGKSNRCTGRGRTGLTTPRPGLF